MSSKPPPTDRDEQAAAYTPAPGGFLDRNPHLIENYLAVCAEFGETPGDVPEEVGAIGRERPPEHVFEAFRRLHSDPHALALEYIDHSISDQVALGYAKPTAERRLSAVKAVERAIWKLRRLAEDA